MKSAWTKARSRTLVRLNPLTREHEALDPDVNYFVEKLEEWDATTHFSCGGHPHGFYILFTAPLDLAQQIVHTGYFSVELQRTGWRLSLTPHEVHYSWRWNEGRKRALLRTTARAWEAKKET